jgi:predicted transcriptional regulator
MQNTSLLPIAQIIKSTLPPNMDFKPKKDFYTEIGINKHRFAKIMKGAIDPTRSELHSISNYFQISTNLFI